MQGLLELTMPLLVQREAEAMWGTITTFSQWSKPGVIFGSSSYTSSPTPANGIAWQWQPL